MKTAILIVLCSLNLSSFAKTYVCNNDSTGTDGGIYQIEINKSESKVAHFRQNDKGEWKKIESGFLNSQKGNDFEFITPKRLMSLNLEEERDEGFFHVSLKRHSASGFGPYISASVMHTALECTVKNVPSFEVDRFVEPANMPLERERFLRLMEAIYKDDMDGYSDVPAFTLVSPDRKDYIVVSFITDKVASVRDFHWGGVSSSKERIISEEVMPKLKAGWKMLSVYSNEEGTKIFKSIKIKQ